nr:trypsin-like peptidase domain-containing protein [uncultured Desulfobulbus sp.]
MHNVVCPALIAGLFTFAPLHAHALTEQEILARNEASLVAVRALDPQSGTIVVGSGVVIAPQQVITSCGLVDGRGGLEVAKGAQKIAAKLLFADAEKGLCLLAADGLAATTAERGRSSGLSMQQSIWAVGMGDKAAALESGVLTQLRGGTQPLIETTLLGTRQTLGRGLFDRDGRLIGIATVFEDNGQNLYFAAPIEWLDSLQPDAEPGGLNRKIHWIKRAALMEEAADWQRLHDVSRQWADEFPQEPAAWHTLGYACIGLHASSEARAAFQETIRINPDDIDGWSNLGFIYTDLEQLPQAVGAYQKVVQIDPRDTDGWLNLSLAYEAVGDHAQAMKAAEELARLDVTRADELRSFLQQKGGAGFDDVEEPAHP